MSASRKREEEEGRIRVNVARLDPEGEEIAGETGDVMDLGDDPFVTPLGGISYSLFVQAVGTELVVRGTAHQDFDLVCSRCNEPFGYRVKVPDFVTSVEINEKTEFVDLTGEVRESIILALPTYPVCREGCKGLCARCGKNLNEGPCGCADESGDSRWGALDALKL